MRYDTRQPQRETPGAAYVISVPAQLPGGDKSSLERLSCCWRYQNEILWVMFFFFSVLILRLLF
jgi:hypothetical protein